MRVHKPKRYDLIMPCIDASQTQEHRRSRIPTLCDGRFYTLSDFLFLKYVYKCVSISGGFFPSWKSLFFFVELRHLTNNLSTKAGGSRVGEIISRFMYGDV